MKFTIRHAVDRSITKITGIYPVRLLLGTAENYPVLLLWLLICTAFLSVLAVMLVYLRYNPAFLMMDDGYYNISRGIYEGTMGVWHQRRYPGLPLLFTLVHTFPEYLHLLIRFYLTLAALGVSLYFGKKIAGDKIPNTTFFAAGILLFCNPLIIHWTIKSAPEPYVTAILGALVILTLKQLRHPSFKNHLFFALALLAAISFKPVFFLIPLTLAVYYLLKRKRVLFVANLIIFATVFSGFLVLKSQVRPHLTIAQKDSYGTNDLLATSFLVKAMFETGQFYYGSDNPAVDMVMPASSVSYQVSKGYKEYRTNYFKNNPAASETEYAKTYILENFGYWSLSKILNPVFFFALTFTPKQAALGAAVAMVLLFLAFRQIRRFHKTHPDETELFLMVLLGFASVHFITFSFARYSFPVIFYLSIYAWSFIRIPGGTTGVQTPESAG